MCLLIEMKAFASISLSISELSHPCFVQASLVTSSRHGNPSSFPTSFPASLTASSKLFSKFRRYSPYSSDSDSPTVAGGDKEDDGSSENRDFDKETQSFSENGVDIEIKKLGRNSRRIVSSIDIEACLDTVWNLLTDYERLADFIPGLAVNQLLEKRDNFARLFQIGQQKVAFGLKFSAKGIVDCFEKELETLPYGQRRDIEFKMIEGDFKIFEGRWSIEQRNELHSTLTYTVDVEPKLWLPVRLVEGRLCKEFVMNLSSIREEARKLLYDTLPSP